MPSLGMLNLTQMKARRRAPPTEKTQFMTKPVAAPEIFQIPLDQIDPATAPPNTKPGTTEFEQGVIMEGVEGRFVGLLPEAEKQNLH